jgi:hypothetical protein
MPTINPLTYPGSTAQGDVNPLNTGGGGGNTATSSAATGNLAAMPYITQLMDQINALNVSAQQKANMARIPGEAGLEATSSANIANLLAGQVSPSTINLLGQQAGERGAMTGSPAGASTNAAYLRALGLTSEQLQAQGQTELSGAVARNPAAPIADPTKQLLTPEQTGTLQQGQEKLAQQQQQFQQQMALEWAKLNRAGGGGGGGGSATAAGKSPTTPVDSSLLFPNTGTGLPGLGDFTADDYAALGIDPSVFGDTGWQGSEADAWASMGVEGP